MSGYRSTPALSMLFLATHLVAVQALAQAVPQEPRLAEIATNVAFDSTHLDANSPTHQPGRWVVALTPRHGNLQPFDVRTRGMTPAEAAAVHAQDVANRVLEYAEDIAAVEEPAIALGITMVDHLPELRMCFVNADPASMQQFARTPGIASVAPDSRCRAHLTSVRRSDPNAIRPEHHGAGLAHEAGFTGLGGTVQPVLAILDSWVNGNFTGIVREHRVLHVGGNANNPSRVFGVFDATGVGSLPPSSGPANRHHGLGMAAFAAGHATDQPASRPFANGQAPNAQMVSVNITRLYPSTTYTCGGLPGWVDPSNFYASVGDMLLGLQFLSANKFVAGSNRPIQVANLSYGGPTNPDHPLNIALDALAVNSGILLVTSAGNYFDPTERYESCNTCNGIAVGATGFVPDGGVLHPVESFSGRGPLLRSNTAVPCWIGALSFNDPLWRLPSDAYSREFPDLAAAGSEMSTPRQDNETTTTAEAGTSISAAIVSGAAALFFAGQDNTNATLRSVLEAKAALLASAENEAVNGVGDNLRGAGFLRTDRLMNAPSFASNTTTQLATVANMPGNTTVATVATRAGGRYGIAITWMRTNLTPGLTNGQPNWADLDLEVIDASGNVLVAASRATVGATFGNRTWERLEVATPAAGLLTVDVRVNRVSPGSAAPIAVGLAVTELTPSITAPLASVTIGNSSSATTCGLPRPVPAASMPSTWPASVPFAPTVTGLQEVALAFDEELNLGTTFNVVRVTVRGRFARDMVLPCRLLGGAFVTHPGSVGPRPGATTNEPNSANVVETSLLHVNAATGLATAEFATVTGARFLAFETTPEMALFGIRADVAAPHIRVCFTRDIGGANWLGYRLPNQVNWPIWGEGSLYYDLVVTPGVTQGSPGQHTFAASAPRLAVAGLPRAGRSYEVLIQNADQQNVASFKAAVIVSDFSPTEVAMPDPGCMSILKGSSLTSQFLFFANNSDATSWAASIPQSAGLLGLTYHHQGIVMEIVNGVMIVRPTREIATVLNGL